MSKASNERAVANSINANNVSIMPLQTRKNIENVRRFSGKRWVRNDSTFIRSAAISHTRAVNRASKRKYPKKPGMGSAFPTLMKL